MIAVDTNILVYAHFRKLKNYWPSLRQILEVSRVNGPRVHDARVAALCQHHGVRELWTADRDFSRFPNLSVVNPLVG